MLIMFIKIEFVIVIIFIEVVIMDDDVGVKKLVIRVLKKLDM